MQVVKFTWDDNSKPVFTPRLTYEWLYGKHYNAKGTFSNTSKCRQLVQLLNRHF